MNVKYNKLGTGYNITRKADPYLVNRLFHHLQPSSKSRYLDIGCGTGNYTIALHQRGVSFIGIDPSEKMLDQATAKSNTITWQLGSAEETGLTNESVDGIIGTLTIHHWEKLHHGFQELYRVLMPGGRLIIFTSSPNQMQGYWLNHYFPKMLRDSIQQMPELERVEEAMQDAGFHSMEKDLYFIQPDLKDLFLYSGKHNPSLYFGQEVRNGISSFADLANREEVEQGLAKLQEDLKTGAFEKIKAQYENELGDYLYIIAYKA